MAAPFGSKYSLSRKSLKIIFVSNFISSLCILSLICFPFNGRSSFDFVNNCLTATKFAIITLWILNVTIAFVSRSSHHNLSLQKVIADVRKGVLVYFCSIMLAYFIAVIKGAPVTESVPETFHFALVLATAAVAPGLVHLGVNTDTWVRLFTMNSPETALERVVQFTTVSSIIGGWLGAFPIPLDWDRPWQVWPITCVLGVLLGYVVGLISSALYLGYQSYRFKLKST